MPGEYHSSRPIEAFLESDPHDEQVLLAMAALLEKRGDLEAAETYAWRAVEALPSWERGWIWLD
jgi:Tfp pilus assembly protein PilF